MKRKTVLRVTATMALTVLIGCDKTATDPAPSVSAKKAVPAAAKTPIAKSASAAKPVAAESVKELQASPDALGRGVFAALQARRFENVAPLLAKKTDLESVMSANTPSDAVRQMFTRNWTRVIAKFQNRARINFDDTIRRAQKLGINWKLARLSKVSHRLKVEQGMTSATITLHIPHKGVDYAIKLDRVMKSNRGWLLTEIVWLGEFKTDQHWANTFAKPLAGLYCRCLVREATTKKPGDAVALKTVLKACDQSKAIGRTVKKFEAAGDVGVKRLFLKVYAEQIAGCEKTLRRKLQ
jgi:hypothetical protein